MWGMEALVTVGVLAAMALSLYELAQGSTIVYFDSMTAIITLVLLGKILETKAKFSTKETLTRLNRALPRKGRKHFANGEEKFVSLKEISVGDQLVALTGEKIVLDGVVEEGEGSVDESLMTGESIPVFVKNGARVIAGTILQTGRLVYRVTSTVEKSTVQRILSMVEQDIGHKSVYIRSIDTIAQLFTPSVVLMALLTYFFSDFTQGLAVLLISCPCAIGIAAPLAESNLIYALAEKGVIVRNRAALRHFGKETVYVFDKTGTITEGKFKVLSGLEMLECTKPGCAKSLNRAFFPPYFRRHCGSDCGAGTSML